MILLLFLIPFLANGQVFDVPPREATALNGEQFINLVTSMDLSDRENEIFAQVMSGNVPDFQRNMVPVTYTETISSSSYTYTYYVIPDYLAIGCDTNYFLCPMTPLLAQRIADATGCTMPTRKMVDDIWTAATVHLSPSSIPPSPEMITIPVMAEHNATVWGQRSAILGAHPLGELVGGDKKDVVISNLIYGYPSPGRVVIYGWHYTSGTPIQPLYNGHEETYADYSHGIRLVQNEMIVNGTSALVTDILQSSTLFSLLSDEGTINTPRYPVVVPEVSVPVSFAVVPASSESLRIIAQNQADVNHFFVCYGNDGLNFPDTLFLHKDSLVITELTPYMPVYLKIAAISSSDSSDFSEVLGATPGEIISDVLVINGFDRPSTGNTFNFIRQHGDAIIHNGYGFSSATNEAVTDLLINLTDYWSVDYILGIESSVNESFSSTEQSFISGFLNLGGNLFVSGAEIAWDLDHLGSADDKYFYNNYLKASYYMDAPNDQSGTFYQIEDYLGSVFSGLGLVSFDDGSNGTYNVNYPDVLLPVGGAEACMQYAGLTDNYAGVCFNGMFPDGDAPGKIVNLGVPFETFYPVESQFLIMQDVLEFFESGTKVLEARTFDVEIYPNPFSDHITIRFANEAPDGCTIAIKDVTGQTKLFVKAERITEINTSKLIPGVYVVIIESKTGTFVRKIVH